MTKKDFQIIAELIATLSFNFKDNCFIIGDSQAYDALMLEELHDTVNDMLKRQNPRFNEEKFWNAVYNHRKKIIEIINK